MDAKMTKSYKTNVLDVINVSNNSLHDYIVERIIGKGNFSTVYKGMSEKDCVPVALKKVKLIEMVNAEARAECIKEIKLLQQLDHPNVIKYLDTFVEQDDLFIVLELADDGDLLKMINRFKMCYIKPANVLMTKGGGVKLGDLGLSRFFSPNTYAAQTIVGTPFYWSPERINGESYTFSSDIWSLGCLLYEMTSLQSPFSGKDMNFYMLCKKIEKCDYAPIPADIYSEEIKKLISSCINCDTKLRPNITIVHEVAREMNVKFGVNK